MFTLSILWIIRHIDGDDTSLARKATLGIGACFFVLVIANALIPSTRLAAAMYIVPAVVNNENVKAIGDNSLEALRLLTEDWLRELAESKDGTPPSK